MAGQGSVLDLELWNVIYKSLLRIGMSKELYLVGHTDNVAALAMAWVR